MISNFVMVLNLYLVKTDCVKGRTNVYHNHWLIFIHSYNNDNVIIACNKFEGETGNNNYSANNGCHLQTCIVGRNGNMSLC